MTHAVGRIASRRRGRLLGALAIAWLCTGATGLPDRGSAADQEACTPDVFRLCGDFIPDEPQILTCLQSKRDQLSPACGRVIGPPERLSRRKRKSAGPEIRRIFA